MDTGVDIRRKANACHKTALAKANGVKASRSDHRRCIGELDDLQTAYYEQETYKGVLGFLDRASQLVNVAKDQDPRDEQVVIAHEIGHYNLHHDPTNEVTVKVAGLGGDPIETGAAKVEGYSPRERKEVQADIFSGELLCPSDWVREEYMAHGRRCEDIATELGLPFNLVVNQLVRALLLPPLRDRPPKQAEIAYVLDDSQRVAATWDKGPLLVDAGPGTGRTIRPSSIVSNICSTAMCLPDRSLR